MDWMESFMAEARPCQRHPEMETRLACSACDTPVCPKCMVTSAVGYKCPDCVKATQSHATKLSKTQWVAAGVLSLLAGAVFSWVGLWLYQLPFWIFGIPVLSLIVAYLLGRLSGRVIHPAIQYKLGVKLSWVMTIFTTTGLLMGPLGWHMVGNAINDQVVYGLLDAVLMILYIRGLRTTVDSGFLRF